MKELDPRDRELLNALQSEIPLISTPYAVVGQDIDMSEKEVLKRCERLRRDGIVKQISAQFDPRSLGYRSSLVAAKVTEEQLDHAASVVNLHPGVTANYRRNHEYNLWFTISLAPGSRFDLETTLAHLAIEARWQSVHQFPTLRSFKSSHEENDEPAEPLTPAEIEVVKLMQQDLPAQPRPFDALARSSGIAAEEILEICRRMAGRHQLKRLSAVVLTRKSSFLASAMGVWRVPENRIDEVGETVAGHRAVTQCFLRPTYDDWPYNVFATVHGRSVDECESVLGEIADQTDLTERRVLFPVKEYKRSRLNLFSGEIEQWEARQDGEVSTAGSVAV